MTFELASLTQSTLILRDTEALVVAYPRHYIKAWGVSARPA
ncbi:unnamed protein product [Acidithrix sp. C25]|nr:unnamed protein product [Acidithrix sp. C25]